MQGEERRELAGWKWNQTYSQLPELFFQRCLPSPVRAPRFLIFNRSLAQELGLKPDLLEQPEMAEYFTGNQIFPGADPLAQAYAGHQFGHFNGLGDGRAILLGEHQDPSGKKWDIQLKGPGRTPYSRGGDGRAAVAPMLREYLISEAMQALGIPTTRSLAVTATGENIQRQTLQAGAVLTRVAASHIRVGSFQWAAAHQDTPALKALMKYTALRHFPEIDPEDALGFLSAVMERQIDLIVHWMRVGFIHGVMNTDNMALSGETIDYGPCAFLDAYDSKSVFSSIDHAGRYAFGHQSHIARWNLARFAETLLPLIHPDRPAAVEAATMLLETYDPLFQERWLAMMRKKIGLQTEEKTDKNFIEDLLDRMEKSGADYTQTFRALSEESALESSPFSQSLLSDWHSLWQQRQARQNAEPNQISDAMKQINPAVIPRNHLVENALQSGEKGDLSPFHELLQVLATPYEIPCDPIYTQAAPIGSEKYVTYCGT